MSIDFNIKLPEKLNSAINSFRKLSGINFKVTDIKRYDHGGTLVTCSRIDKVWVGIANINIITILEFESHSCRDFHETCNLSIEVEATLKESSSRFFILETNGWVEAVEGRKPTLLEVFAESQKKQLEIK